MAVELLDELGVLGFVAAIGLAGPGPGREVVPARAARGLGVGRDDFDAVLDQVAPVGDAPWGCPCGRGTRWSRCRASSCSRTRPRQLASISPDLSAMALMSPSSARVTTSASRPSITDCACLPEPPWLCSMVTVAAGLGLPVGGERRVELLVELAGRIVADVQQHLILGAYRKGKAQYREQRARRKRAVWPFSSLVPSR